MVDRIEKIGFRTIGAYREAREIVSRHLEPTLLAADAVTETADEFDNLA